MAERLETKWQYCQMLHYPHRNKYKEEQTYLLLPYLLYGLAMGGAETVPAPLLSVVPMISAASAGNVSRMSLAWDSNGIAPKFRTSFCGRGVTNTGSLLVAGGTTTSLIRATTDFDAPLFFGAFVFGAFAFVAARLAVFFFALGIG